MEEIVKVVWLDAKSEDYNAKENPNKIKNLKSFLCETTSYGYIFCENKNIRAKKISLLKIFLYSSTDII